MPLITNVSILKKIIKVKSQKNQNQKQKPGLNNSPAFQLLKNVFKAPIM